MALVKLLRSGQVTVPAEARKALQLKEGDYLEAEIVAGALVLKPVSMVDREAAWQQVFEALESVRYVGPKPDPNEDQVMDMVVEEIHAMRRENEKKGRSR